MHYLCNYYSDYNSCFLSPEYQTQSYRGLCFRFDSRPITDSRLNGRGTAWKHDKIFLYKLTS